MPLNGTITTEEFIGRLVGETTPVAGVDTGSRTVHVSASRTAIDVALSIAAGAEHDIGWAFCDDTSFLAIGYYPNGGPLVLAFTSPRDDEFLVAIATHDDLTLQVEGTIPVTLPVRRHDDALRPYLHHRGWSL